MILYSVTVNIEQELAADWLEWMLNEHIPEVLDTGYFEHYTLQEVISPEAEAGTKTYNVQYQCPTLEHYELYRTQHAPRLQQSHNERYAGKFVAFRTLLNRIV